MSCTPRKAVALAAGILFATVTAIPATAMAYRFTRLDSIAGDVVINGSNNVAGALSVNGYEAGVYADGITVHLQSLGGYFTEVNGINGSGQATGFSMLPSNDIYHATLWNGGMVTDLGTLATDSPNAVSQGNGINAAGHVAGFSGQLGALHPIAWYGSSATLLATPATGTGYGIAMAINGSDQIVGSVGAAGGHYHAALWNGTGLIDLGSVFDGDSNAVDINDAGQVVGSASYFVQGKRFSQAVLWSAGSVTLLGSLDGTLATPTAINAAGQVVGYSIGGPDAQLRATLWIGEQAIDLNTYLPPDAVRSGWELQSANDINDRGVIVGIARNTYSGLMSTFLLSPVPEPGIPALLASGILVLLAAYRRAHSTR